MVAQVDEQQIAMVALAMDPARQADGLAGLFGAELAAGVGAVGVHGIALGPWRQTRAETPVSDTARAGLSSRGSTALPCLRQNGCHFASLRATDIMRWIFALLLFLAAGTALGEEPQPPFFTADDCPAGTVLPEAIAVECGTVTVLEDRTRPDGPRIRLRVATLWRTDQELRPDPLLFINGGPGYATGLMAEWLSGWAGQCRSHWSGSARAAWFCSTSGASGNQGCLPSPCGPFDLYERQFILDHQQPRRRDLDRPPSGRAPRDAGPDSGRRDTIPAGSPPPRSPPTSADLRQALGYPAWNLWGISFGSRVAMTVMRDHPRGRPLGHPRRRVAAGGEFLRLCGQDGRGLRRPASGMPCRSGLRGGIPRSRTAIPDPGRAVRSPSL